MRDKTFAPNKIRKHSGGNELVAGRDEDKRWSTGASPTCSVLPVFNHTLLQISHRIIESEDHRMAWVEKDHNDHPVSTPLLCAGSPTTRPGCPEPHPAWPWMPPEMGHPQPPWATCSSEITEIIQWMALPHSHYKQKSQFQVNRILARTSLVWILVKN